MSANTKIEWADHTFNPWIGCTKVSPGCDHCYAKAEWDDRRHRAMWGPGHPRSLTKTWGDPKKWNDQHEAFYAQHGRRQRVFCASLADWLDNEVPANWLADLFELIYKTPNLDWLLLTKRIGNFRARLQAALEHAEATAWKWAGKFIEWLRAWLGGTPPSNAWLGATIVNQAEADRDIPKLLQVPAAKRFLSMEPLLGPVDLTAVKHTASPGFFCDCLEWYHRPHSDRYTKWPGIDWVIVGGESGPGARPMHSDWARSLRDQCQAAGVPFLFKQWGEWLPADQYATACWANGRSPTVEFNHLENHRMHRVGKKAAGRLLDGRTWDEVPV